MCLWFAVTALLLRTVDADAEWALASGQVSFEDPSPVAFVRAKSGAQLRSIADHAVPTKFLSHPCENALKHSSWRRKLQIGEVLAAQLESAEGSEVDASSASDS